MRTRAWMVGFLVTLGAGCSVDTAGTQTTAAGAGGGNHATHSSSDGSGYYTTSSTGGLCQPGSVSDCYTGPPTTEGVGSCHQGQSTCDAKGQPGPCVGEVLPAPENCATAASEACETTPQVACSGDFGWAAVMTGAGNDAATAIAADATGHAYVTGYYRSVLGFPDSSTLSQTGDNSSMFLAVFDPQGVLLKKARFAGPLGVQPDDQSGSAVAVNGTAGVVLAGTFTNGIDLGNGVITGQTVNNAFVASFDAALKLGWATTFQGTGAQTASTVAVGADGSAVVGGSFRTGMVVTTPSNTNFATGSDQDGFLVKVSNTGSPLWAKQLMGQANRDQWIQSVAVGPGGIVAVTGTAHGTADFGGAPATFVPAGATPADDDDLFVAVFDTNGGQLHLTHFVGPGNQSGTGIAFDAAGDIFVTGSFTGQLQFDNGNSLDSDSRPNAFVIKLDPTGAVVAKGAFGSPNTDQVATSIAVDPAGNLVVGGYFNGTFDVGATTLTQVGGWDAFLFKLDNGLNSIWALSFASAPNGFLDQTIAGVAVDTQAHVYAAGAFNTQITFDSTHSGTGVDQSDAFALGLAP